MVVPGSCRAIQQRLETLARRTRSIHAREAILRRMEDLVDVCLARRRIRHCGHRVSLDDLERELTPPTGP